MPLVLDASTALAWYFEDEDAPSAIAAIQRLRQDRGHVPVLWLTEVANGLLVAERRGRISSAKVEESIAAFEGLSLVQEQLSLSEVLGRVLNLARQQNLTAYDAAYLDLALRTGYPLATQDTDLIAAAGRVGVPILVP